MRNFIWAVPAILIGMHSAAIADTVLPGTEVAVRTDQPIELHTWDRGRIYPARVARDVVARDGDVAIPRGASAELIVRQTGPNEMALDLESVTVNGRRYAMDTSGPEFRTNQDYDNGAGLLGNIVGELSGGRVQVETRGNEIRVPEGSMIRFQLREPLHVVGWGDPGYMQQQYHYHRQGDWYR